MRLKQLFIIVMSILSLNMVAQTDSTYVVSEGTLTETERIIDKYSSNISDAFTNGVEKVLPFAEDAFNMVVKLQIAEGIVRLLPILIFFISFRLFNTENKRIRKLIEDEGSRNKYDNSTFNVPNVTPQMIIYFVITILSGIGTIFLTYGGLVRIIVPEWFAVKEIIHLF